VVIAMRPTLLLVVIIVIVTSSFLPTRFQRAGSS
jgi:hypothetical protein